MWAATMLWLFGQALLQNELPLCEHGVAVSSRASFELMQKAMIAGIPMLAAVGAPSSLVVEFAEEFSITLVGFLKADRFDVYSRLDRILPTCIEMGVHATLRSRRG